MSRFVFDLDGVIRHLSLYMVGSNGVTDWNQDMPFGGSFMDVMEENLDLLKQAPPTRYYPAIHKYGLTHKLEIITRQPVHWREKTMYWIMEHLDANNVNVHFVDEADEKLEMLGPDDVLVEDYPFFTDYKKVALIDYSYNQNVTGELVRIMNPDDLYNLLFGSPTLGKDCNDRR